MRDKIYQKEYENKHRSSQKRVKVPKKVPKPSHTLIKMKRIPFFLTKKGSLLKSSHRKSSIKKLFFPISLQKPSWLQHYQKQTPTQVFSCEYCEIFKSTYFDGHLQTAASVFQKPKLSAFE